jgi:hypothetical protein
MEELTLAAPSCIASAPSLTFSVDRHNPVPVAILGPTAGAIPRRPPRQVADGKAGDDAVDAVRNDPRLNVLTLFGVLGADG